MMNPPKQDRRHLRGYGTKKAREQNEERIAGMFAWNDMSYDEQQIAKQTIFSLVEYEPTEAQLPIHETAANIIVVSGGEGSGKSQSTAAEVAAEYPTWRKVLFVAYKAESAHNEGDYLATMLEKFGALERYDKPKEGNIQIFTRDGAWVHSVSTHQKGAQVVTGTGKGYDIICILEAGKQPYSVFLACLVRASRQGARLIISGTIEKSEPWFPDLIKTLRENEQKRKELDAEIVIIPTWSNHKLYPGGRDDPKIKTLEATLPPELFMERLAGEPSPPEGLVIKGFSFLTHVFDWVQFDETLEVELGADPGYSGSHYSVPFFQIHPRAYTRKFLPTLPDLPIMDVWVIGDLYLHYATHQDVIGLAKELPWWANVRGGVGDVIMKTHPQADRAPLDVWKENAGIFLRAQPVSVADNVDRHRTFIQHYYKKDTWCPRIFFNPLCKGVTEYGKWRRKLIAEDTYGAPEDKNCDFTKAVGYWLIDKFGRVEKRIQDNIVAAGERITLEKLKSDPMSIPTIPNNTRNLQQIQRAMRQPSSSSYVAGKLKPKSSLIR